MVIVHEWNEPELVAALGRAPARAAASASRCSSTTPTTAPSATPKRSGASTSKAMTACSPSAKRSREVYRRWGWGGRVWTWHEAADTRLFRPPEREAPREGLVWIGNWGDDERSAELESFLLRPARTAGLPLDIHGVRYPDARAAHAGASTARATAAGCRTPACRRSSPATSPPSTCRAASTWTCCPASRPSACSRRWPAASRSSPRPGATPRGLFRPGEDYLVARNEAEMARHMARHPRRRRAAPRPGRERARGDPRPAQLRAPRGGAARHPARPGRA